MAVKAQIAQKKRFIAENLLNKEIGLQEALFVDNVDADGEAVRSLPAILNNGGSHGDRASNATTGQITSSFPPFLFFFQTPNAPRQHLPPNHKPHQGEAKLKKPLQATRTAVARLATGIFKLASETLPQSNG